MRTSLLWFPLLLLLGACSNKLSSNDEARLAYLGLDTAVTRAMDLGLKGYGDANSANIPDETGSGDLSGTMTVSGQVDQGTSDNKELRLDVALSNYADTDDVDPSAKKKTEIVYDTAQDSGQTALPYLQLSLRNVPNGTLTGTWDGTFQMSGDLAGSVTLALTLSGNLQEGSTAGTVARVPGSTHVTGTATNDSGGTYSIDVTL